MMDKGTVSPERDAENKQTFWDAVFAQDPQNCAPGALHVAKLEKHPYRPQNCAPGALRVAAAAQGFHCDYYETQRAANSAMYDLMQSCASAVIAQHARIAALEAQVAAQHEIAQDHHAQRMKIEVVGDVQPPQHSAAMPSDAEIEEFVKARGVRWTCNEHVYAWLTEDADLHPMIRAVLVRWSAPQKPWAFSAIEKRIESLMVDTAHPNSQSVARAMKQLVNELHSKYGPDLWGAPQAAELPERVPLGQWIDPNDKAQKQYLPHIGEPVLFCYQGQTYYGKHTGGSFVSGAGFSQKQFDTWSCHWMRPPLAHGITGKAEGEKS